MKKCERQVKARLGPSVPRRFVVLGLAALVACASVPDVPQIRAGTPYVRLSNGGSIFGGSSATIYQGDVVIYASSDGTGAAARQGYAVLRFGAFERLRLAALEAIGQAEGQAEGAVPCMDYGTDVIEVWDRESVSSVAATCPGTDVLVAQAALRRLLEAEVAG